MRYFKSPGFFSLGYVFVFLCFNLGASLFISNSQLLTTITYAGIAVYTILYAILCEKDIRKTFRFHKIHPVSILLLILLTCMIRPAAGFISQIGQLFFHDMTTSSITQGVADNFPIMLITTALLPGIIEELIFRGVVYSGLRKANPIKGIFLTALFFGIAHMNFQQFCYAFFLGIIFGFIVEATDSIFSSMIMHITFNASSLGLTYLIYKSDTLSKLMETQTLQNNSLGANFIDLAAYLPVVVITFGISILLIAAIAHLNGRLGYIKTWFSKDIRKTWPKEKATSISYFAALGICFTISILLELMSSFL